MTPANLSITFGPILLRPRRESLDLRRINQQNLAVEYLVRHFDAVFSTGSQSAKTSPSSTIVRPADDPGPLAVSGGFGSAVGTPAKKPTAEIVNGGSPRPAPGSRRDGSPAAPPASAAPPKQAFEGRNTSQRSLH